MRKIEIRLLPQEERSILHIITIPTTDLSGGRVMGFIYYRRPLDEYSRVESLSQRADSFGQPPLLKERYADEFDNLLLETIQEKYPSAWASQTQYLFDVEKEYSNRYIGGAERVCFTFVPHIPISDIQALDETASWACEVTMRLYSQGNPDREFEWGSFLKHCDISLLRKIETVNYTSR